MQKDARLLLIIHPEHVDYADGGTSNFRLEIRDPHRTELHNGAILYRNGFENRNDLAMFVEGIRTGFQLNGLDFAEGDWSSWIRE